MTQHIDTHAENVADHTDTQMVKTTHNWLQEIKAEQENSISKSYTNTGSQTHISHVSTGETIKPTYGAIVGNPPYQKSIINKETNRVNNVNVFQQFYEIYGTLSEKSTMIFPGGRWIQKSYSCEMMAESIYKTVSSIYWFPNGAHPKHIQKIFPHAKITDGLAIVYTTNNISDNVYLSGEKFKRPINGEILPLPIDLLPIVKRAQSYMDTITDEPKNIIHNIRSRTFFGLFSDFTTKNPHKVKLDPNQTNTTQESQTETNTQKADTEQDTNYPIHGWLADDKFGTSKRVKKYLIKEDAVKWTAERKTVYNKWKVATSGTNVSKYPDNSNYAVIPSGCLVGESWTIFGDFDTEQEATNYRDYLLSPTIKALFAASAGGRLKKWGWFIPNLINYTNENPLFTPNEQLNKTHTYYNLDLDQRIQKLLKFNKTDSLIITNRNKA